MPIDTNEYTKEAGLEPGYRRHIASGQVHYSADWLNDDQRELIWDDYMQGKISRDRADELLRGVDRERREQEAYRNDDAEREAGLAIADLENGPSPDDVEIPATVPTTIEEAAEVLEAGRGMLTTAGYTARREALDKAREFGDGDERATFLIHHAIAGLVDVGTEAPR
jgi:hypothetical protein